MHTASLLLATHVLPTRTAFLTLLATPNVAVLLLLAGLLLVYMEFNLPGTVLPGALGVLCVAFALYGLSQLPLRPTAIFFLGIATLLLLLEVKLPSHGVLAMIGTLALVFGLLTLVDGAGGARVDPAVAVAAGSAFGGITFVLAWVSLRARRNKGLGGAEAMVGLVGRVLSPLAPKGQIEVRGEIWEAISATPLQTGDRAVITALRRLTLHVAPLNPGAPAATPLPAQHEPIRKV